MPPSMAPVMGSQIKPGSEASDLEQLLLLRSTLEPVFVAINVEGASTIACQFDQSACTQTGIAILDTRDVHSTLKTKLEIKTINFVTGSNEYFATTMQEMLWGTSQHIPSCKTKMLESINSVISRDRNFVLVGHGFINDIAALHALGFDFCTSILGYFDTESMARKLNLGETSLGGVLKRFGCSIGKLQVAGNTADFTLRALILMAVKSCSSMGAKLLDGTGEVGQRSVLEATTIMPLTFKDLEAYHMKVAEKMVESIRTSEEREWSESKENRVE
jgi:hypothetical protein